MVAESKAEPDTVGTESTVRVTEVKGELDRVVVAETELVAEGLGLEEELGVEDFVWVVVKVPRDVRELEEVWEGERDTTMERVRRREPVEFAEEEVEREGERVTLGERVWEADADWDLCEVGEREPLVEGEMETVFLAFSDLVRRGEGDPEEVVLGLRLVLRDREGEGELDKLSEGEREVFALPVVEGERREVLDAVVVVDWEGEEVGAGRVPEGVKVGVLEVDVVREPLRVALSEGVGEDEEGALGLLEVEALLEGLGVVDAHWVTLRLMVFERVIEGDTLREGVGEGEGVVDCEVHTVKEASGEEVEEGLEESVAVADGVGVVPLLGDPVDDTLGEEVVLRE